MASTMGEASGPIPRVSIVMSVFNGGALLADAIDSILGQTLTDFEFIIVNDGSADGTLAVLQSYAAKDARICIIDQANTGLTKALIRGVAAARAPLIARMDADDLSHPERLERQVALLDARPDLVAVSCGIEYVAHDLRSIAVAERRCDETSLPLLMAFSNVISGHGQMVFRKAVYDAAGGYDAAFRFAQDYDLWCRMLTHGPIGEADGVLYRFRVGHDSITARHGDQQRALAAGVAARQYAALFGVGPDAALARDTLVLWGQPATPALSAQRLIEIDQHMRRAVDRYWSDKAGSPAMVMQVRKAIADIWTNAYRQTPASALTKKALLAMLAARWAPSQAAATLGRKVAGSRPVSAAHG